MNNALTTYPPAGGTAPGRVLWLLSGWILAALLLLGGPDTGQAASVCAHLAGTAVSVQGSVQIKRRGSGAWMPLSIEAPLCAGDSVRIGPRSRAAVLLVNETLLRLDQDSAISFGQVQTSKPSWMDLLKGAIHFISRTPRSLKVKTPFVNAAIEGTEFLLRATDREGSVVVFEGRVGFTNTAGTLSLGPGEAAVAAAGKAPVRQLIARPRDAVAWALYYPPIADYRIERPGAGTSAAQLRAALASYRKGRLAEAFSELDRVPQARRSAEFYALRAGLLLEVGQVAQAEADIARALRLDPHLATPSALQAIIALVNNDKARALQLAEQATAEDPKSSAAQIALSYAYQGRFDLVRATRAARRAVALAPDDPLAWARLAELELSQGELDRALEAAKRSVALDPQLARTQMVLGFAHLARIDIGAARSAFTRAIALDPAAPLAHLGLGLALIRAGELDAGVKEIEVAAILDPNNALIRSYLGKAYYEQKRERLAASEFRIAKGLDPSDPTPYFYDAILKQTINRPVEALHDLQEAITLNDNRAVYRSRFLLDEDLAARSSNIARVYDDLGFQQRALLEGWSSVAADPADASGHRFLADTYKTLPGHEIARASELLQAQLLQPLNITPVQPRQAATNLLILDGAGPGRASFNEYNPLFTRNRLALQAAGSVGSDATHADELILSGVQDKLSMSLGQFYFDTDGFDDNADLRQQVLDGFVQASISPRHNVQAEYRYENIDSGDLAQRIKPGGRSKGLKRRIESNSGRLGYHFQASPRSDLIASVSYTDRDETQRDRSGGESLQTLDTVGYTTEAQYLYHGSGLKLTAGGGFYYTDNDFLNSQTITNFLGMPVPLPTVDEGFHNRDFNGYAYTQAEYPARVEWTVGLGADSYRDSRDDKFDRDQLNPKLGVMWTAPTATTVRAAWFRTLKRPLAINQTIEPTQVAGFNQFFDDFNGTESKRYGLGLDQRLTRDLLAGAELSKRDLSVPRQAVVADFDFSTFTLTRSLRFYKEDYDEKRRRAYLYWTPTERIALSAEYFFEYQKRQEEPGLLFGNEPRSVRTHRLPIGLRYFHPGGLFAQWQLSYVDQKVKFPELSAPPGFPFNPPQSKFKDDFWLLDMTVGYRLPKRAGIVSLVVKNLTNEHFDFQNTDVAGDPRVPLFQPGRSIFINLSLSL